MGTYDLLADLPLVVESYALVEDPAGALVTTAAHARATGALALRFHDGRVRANVEDAPS